MITRDKKEKIVSDFRERLNRQHIVIFAQICGVAVAVVEALRRALRANNAEYKIARKTLMQRAFDAEGVVVDPAVLDGEIGVTFGYGDPLAPLKDLVKFVRGHEMCAIKGAVLDGRFYSPAEVQRIVKVPPREQLLGQLAGVLQFPMRGLVIALSGNTRNLAVVLNRIKEKKS